MVLLYSFNGKNQECYSGIILAGGRADAANKETVIPSTIISSIKVATIIG